MTEPTLAQAIASAVGAEPLKIIAVEDLYKGQLALFADRAVWVEERLGVFAVRGVYPFSAATNVELREGFLGKELSLTVDGKTICFRKLVATDAQELCALFGGSQTPEATAMPLQTEAMPPPSKPQPIKPQPSRPPTREQPKPQKQTRARAVAKQSVKESLKALVVPAVIVATINLAGEWLPRMLTVPCYWFAFAALGAWSRPERYPVFFRYGAGAAAVALGFHIAMMSFGLYWPGMTIVLCYLIITLGAFAVQRGSFDRRKVAGLGAVIGLLDSWFIHSVMSRSTLESFIAPFVSFILYWWVMAFIEQEPEILKTLRS